ncbi:GGDEF domain-containing protein [Planococcus beigongshangi]|uniref:GGDEF domain-containing protein n=1 Tax=Planococcus beigongshangi TaxID=2782536 RepID=UPI00193BC99F|nr:GGDEF domain-containing protein [Planococcus beigongshangi]
MDVQLDLAPVGYLVMDENMKILEMNGMMRDIVAVETVPVHIHDILTIASRVYFQTYFIPAIITHGTVSEMYLKFKNPAGSVPVLMNTKKRNGLFECAIMQVSIRNEYETELLNAKREAEEVSKATAEANSQLKLLLGEVEAKQAELNVLNGRLKELTVTDALTGLKNRRYLEEFLPELMTAGSLSLLMIDIDFFKGINDTYGHHAGDIMLKQLAAVLEEAIGTAGFAARLGGEEFVAVLTAMDVAEASEIAEEVRQRVEHHAWPYRPITISIGVSVHNGNDTLAGLLNRADAALYESKNNGRNRVTVAT